MGQLSVSQKVVVHSESTWGTALTDDSSTFGIKSLPIESANLNLVIDPFNDQTKRGAASLDGNIYPTVRRIEGTIEGPFFVDECGYFLLALLGSEAAVATDASRDTHTFYAKTDFSSTPNSLTIDVRDDTYNATYLGCYVNNLTLRFSAAEGILTYSAGITGRNRAAMTDSGLNTDEAFADKVPPFGWRGTVKRGTATRTTDGEATIFATSNWANVIDAEVTFNRPTALMYVFAQQQVANQGDPGPLEATVRLTADYNSSVGETLLGEYENDTRYGWIFELDNNQSTTELRSILLYFPEMSMLDAPQEIDRSDVAMRVSLNLRAVHNSDAAIAGPVRIKTATGLTDTKYYV